MRFALVLGRLLCAFPAYCLCLARSDAMLWLRYFTASAVFVSVLSVPGRFASGTSVRDPCTLRPARACLRVLYLAFPALLLWPACFASFCPIPPIPAPHCPDSAAPACPALLCPCGFCIARTGNTEAFPRMIHRILPRKQRDPAVRAPYFSCPEGSSAPPCGMLFPARKEIFKK